MPCVFSSEIAPGSRCRPEALPPRPLVCELPSTLKLATVNFRTGGSATGRGRAGTGLISTGRLSSRRLIVPVYAAALGSAAALGDALGLAEALGRAVPAAA